MKSIIFVCLGNICRSPLAEGIARKIVTEQNIDIKIDSADISAQIVRKVTKVVFNTYVLIFALDESNITNLKKLGAKNILKLGSFGYNNEDVPDPYFFDGFEGFDKVYEMIEACVTELIKEHTPKC